LVETPIRRVVEVAVACCLLAVEWRIDIVGFAGTVYAPFDPARCIVVRTVDRDSSDHRTSSMLAVMVERFDLGPCG
jgi:hypothetical protein